MKPWKWIICDNLFCDLELESCDDVGIGKNMLLLDGSKEAFGDGEEW
jgi:hypothetical protein